MMGLRRTVQSLLGLPDDHGGRCRPAMAAAGGVGLRCVAGELPRLPANVLGAAAVGSGTQAAPSLQQEPAEKIDEGNRGLSFLCHRGGLELCTESLGFESCCDGKMGVEEEKTEMEIRRRIEETSCRKAASPSRRRKTEAREFPPPLPWLSAGGGNGYLKAVKKDGRLVLTEVRLRRPEILRASRHGGRLRLELVKSPAPEEEEKTGEVAEDEDRKLQSRRRPAAPPGGQMRSGVFGRRCQEAVREGLLPPPPPFWGAARFVTTA